MTAAEVDLDVPAYATILDLVGRSRNGIEYRRLCARLRTLYGAEWIDGLTWRVGALIKHRYLSREWLEDGDRHRSRLWITRKGQEALEAHRVKVARAEIIGARRGGPKALRDLVP